MACSDSSPGNVPLSEIFVVPPLVLDAPKSELWVVSLDQRGRCRCYFDLRFSLIFDPMTSRSAVENRIRAPEVKMHEYSVC